MKGSRVQVPFSALHGKQVLEKQQFRGPVLFSQEMMYVMPIKPIGFIGYFFKFVLHKAFQVD